MAAWTIHYWGDGGLCGKVVAADSKTAALALAGVPAPRVERVSRRWLPSPDGLAGGVWFRPSVKVQALFLARALALFAGGNTALINGLITTLPELKRLVKRRAEALRDDLELSAKLQRLDFSPAVVAIVEAGERTGNPVQAIETALAYLKQNIEIGRKSSKQFMFGALLIAASLSLFIFLPLLLAEPIDMLRNLRDVRVNLTPATYVLMSVKTAVADYGWLVAACFAGAGFAAWRFRRVLLRTPLLAAFGSLERTKRSINFLIVWRAFRSAGIPLEEQGATLAAALGPQAAARVSSGLKRGESLTDTLTPRFFSPTLVLAVAGLSQVGARTFLKIVDALLTSLHEEQQAGAARAAAAMYAVGVALTVATVSLLAFGLIFPIMSTSAGGG